ncbi:MAG: cell division protein FtsK [Candidatus Sedimenticola endophacoides]|uniref:DNA translocase FtsK n=1 Tax=Candidatus Sedimenticola endophacoides TaxID=2548426 RepID=A0A6N4DWG0_9GAMM|nr:MAG: cell division protein FtsK [Candidatus Sedimenticola endophacoides]PUE02859.1 MAG: cell division protein FtsK [Candidatus Sedimenticola endophacoides]PUE02899.1 MAG: cell division protein FtsK [Candidatus Sedimenticola endophacoides]
MHVGRRLREVALLLLVAVAVYLILSLITFSPGDPGWSFTGSRDHVTNAGGPVGAWFADVFLYLFGVLAILFPVMVGLSGWLIYKERNPDDSVNIHLVAIRWIGFLVTLAAGSALFAMQMGDAGTLPAGAGGILGRFLQGALVAVFNFAGSTLLLLALLLAGFTLFTGISWFTVMDSIGGALLRLYRGSLDLKDRLDDWRRSRQARRQRSEAVRTEKKKTEKRKPVRIEPSVKVVEPSQRAEKERQAPLFEPTAMEGGLPPLALLEPAKSSGKGYSKEALEAMSRQVELKLRDFGVEVEVESVHPGPVVTLFELRLAPGTKVSKITNLAKDLARALSTISVRVVEVIPGKSVIGLEIPNEYREMVYLSEVLHSQAYEGAKSVLTLALGKDIAGNPSVADLGKMPHVLIAGTTGSGKSVAINAMVLSLLYKASPQQVRLIMVDPKMLELSVYEGIPHLLSPVVTDMKEAANALRWCVGEMERRYRLMAAMGVRNIAGFNKKVREAEKRGEPIPDPLYQPDPMAITEAGPVPLLTPLPYIVVIIDELADMMMVVGKKVEELIARLAQKARASGIHLLLATQRPSVDVITGLIKANIPTRVAFQVSSRVDSRTILDQMGAEHLLGHGDMLYMPPGTSIPQRIHGAFVDDNEVHRVADHLRQTGEPDYIDAITQEPTEAIPGLSGEPTGDVEDSDPLYDEAVQIVTESRRASISGVQRRLKIGYNRAARLIEEMERTGIVTPAGSNGNREVLAPPPPGD